MKDLESLVARLEAVTSRLQKCSTGKASSANDDDDDYGKYILIFDLLKNISTILVLTFIYLQIHWNQLLSLMP